MHVLTGRARLTRKGMLDRAAFWDIPVGVFYRKVSPSDCRKRKASGLKIFSEKCVICVTTTGVEVINKEKERVYENR